MTSINQREPYQAWEEIDQRVIDKAVSELRKRLRMCVKAAGKQFEYKLWLAIHSRYILGSTRKSVKVWKSYK